MRTSSGVARSKIEVIIVLMQVDLPAPVAPATSRCGILARFATTEPALDVLAQAHHHRVVVADAPPATAARRRG